MSFVGVVRSDCLDFHSGDAGDVFAWDGGVFILVMQTTSYASDEEVVVLESSLPFFESGSVRVLVITFVPKVLRCHEPIVFDFVSELSVFHKASSNKASTFIFPSAAAEICHMSVWYDVGVV